MPLTSALLMTLVLASGPERILLCRPMVQGDASLARAEALREAERPLQALFLDYGVACESLEEAVRAAGRAGLRYGLFSRADGQADGAHFLLVLATAQADEVARRSLQVAPGADAAGPLRAALRELEETVPRPPPRWPTVASWTLIGVGVAALAAGTVFALQARDQARRADAATTPEAYQAAIDAWERDRARSIAALAGAGGALAVGATLRIAF